MSRFLSWPNRGGWLTIANLLTWLCLFLLLTLNLGASPAGWIILLPMLLLHFLMSLPLAIYCLIPLQDFGGDPTLPVLGIVLNSFLWGYGVDRIVRKIQRKRAYRAQLREQGDLA